MDLSSMLALAIIAFPVLLILGIALIPLVTNYADHEQAQRAATQSGRWFWGHLLSGVAFSYGVLAACCVAVVLYTENVFVWAMIGLPLIATGAGFQIAGMGADGIGPLAVGKAGHPARIFFDGSRLWVTGTFIAGSILFALGQIVLVIGIQHTALVSDAVGIIMMLAAILFSISTAIPAGWGLYVVGGSALILYLPLSLALWQRGGALVLQAM